MTKWKLVRREATPEMVAEVLPRCHEKPTDAQLVVGAKAIAIINPTGGENASLGVTIAAELARDHTALVAASPDPLGDDELVERLAQILWPLFPMDGSASVSWVPVQQQHRVEWADALDKEQDHCRAQARAILAELGGQS